jgi:glycerol-3-phosphate cytidylyltransferase-like family protein
MGDSKTVLVFGTFDGIHRGHAYFLGKLKRKEPLYTEDERSAELVSCGLVDRVYLSDPVPGSYQILAEVKPDLICLGYDQDDMGENLRRWLEARRTPIPLVRLEHDQAGGSSVGRSPGR